MQPVPTQRPDHYDEAPPKFNVVVAYEDRATSQRALQTCDFIARTLGEDVEVSKSLWKFDLLRTPGLKELAATDAELADMIILSAHEDEIPPFVQTWLEGSTRADLEYPRALVALFDRTVTGNSSVQHLQDLASHCRMDFFWRRENGRE